MSLQAYQGYLGSSYKRSGAILPYWGSDNKRKIAELLPHPQNIEKNLIAMKGVQNLLQKEEKIREEDVRML